MTDRVGEIEQLLDEALALAWTEGKTGSYQAEAEAGKQKALAQVRALVAEGERMRLREGFWEDYAKMLSSYAYYVDRTAHPLEDHARVKRLVADLKKARTPAPPAATSEEGTSGE